ncbi:MAG: hypothetical protein JKY65_13285 [Planctomycetes bacterium]|nr:hypothetical protein [Planctomycetota bacterium]
MAKRKPKRKKKPKPKHETVPLAEVLQGVELPTDCPEQVLVGADIDVEIAPLVRALTQAGAVTLGSCSGHGRGDACVDFAVRGLDGIRKLVQLLNAADSDELPLMDVGLNWSQEVATACCFEEYPDWVMFSLKIEEPLEGDLAALAKGMSSA